jgi:hypothetical protein
MELIFNFFACCLDLFIKNDSQQESSDSQYILNTNTEENGK